MLLHLFITLTLLTALSMSAVTPTSALNINSTPKLGINSNLDSNLQTSLFTSFSYRAVVKTLTIWGEDFF